ncbi:hypothetical protein BDQ17DRAFT_1405296 [Cyathus striatus]|nr:hypothetical protein BDQ17DRAFT_1405296 [Cyathus striatus]
MAPDTTTTAIKHETYFWDTIVFSVQGTLFKVPRYHFRSSSSIFRDCFSLPQGKGPKEGDSEEYPLKLDGIDKVDFERLLKVLYPVDISRKTKEDVHEQLEKWTSVLKLSTLYNMLAPRRLAIKRLEKVITHDFINQIILGRVFKIPHWFEAGCTSLVERNEGFDLSDAETLDYRTSFILYMCRETRQSYNHSYAHDYTEKISDLVREAFNDEIEELRVASLEYEVPNPAGSVSGSVRGSDDESF